MLNEHADIADRAQLRAQVPQGDLFQTSRVPVLAAYGTGVNSTAPLIELVERKEPPDAVLFADTGGEWPETYAYLGFFGAWLAERQVPIDIVRYEPKDFKNYPPYRTLEENCLTNGTLPSKAFGFCSCSSKWKVQPQNRWSESWPPAQAVWAARGKVIKLIGYDCSPQDQKRYAEREGDDDPRYEYRYPLREWGWDRDDCVARILAAGLPVPRKSACYFCPVTKPHEVDAMHPAQLRRIVLMEARAKPRLRTVEGLWRTAVKGCRGAVARPGSITAYIRQRGLLPIDEINAIEQLAPLKLTDWQDSVKSHAVRPELAEWLKVFDAASGSLHVKGMEDLFSRCAEKTSP